LLLEQQPPVLAQSRQDALDLKGRLTEFTAYYNESRVGPFLQGQVVHEVAKRSGAPAVRDGSTADSQPVVA
jgi:hypothetical protein